MAALLALHILGGSLALVAGFAALVARKGAGLHRTAGLLFSGSMLLMCAAALALYAAHGRYRTAFGTALVAYLVITAVTTMRPRTDATWHVDRALALLALALGANGIVGGVQTLATPTGRTADGAPGGMVLFLGLVALLACWGDVRVLRSGAPRGAARLRRHLWRMCFALFIASGSFFLGQAKVIPEPLRITPLLALLAVLPLLVMPYFAWRLRSRRGRAAIPVRPGTSADAGAPPVARAPYEAARAGTS
jgi:hypothetical protein